MKNPDQGHENRLDAVRSVHMTKVKILSYRSTKAWLIRCLLYGANKNNLICLV